MKTAMIKASLFTPLRGGRWGLPLLFWGAPGVAKTSVVEEVCAKFDLACEVLSPGERGEGAFGVVPVPSKSGVLTYPRPDWTMRFDETRRGVVFVDELTTAAPAIQAPLLGLFLARRVGGYQLPPGVRTMAAANPPDLAAGGYDLASSLANRVGHVEWPAPEVSEHVAFMLGADADTEVRAEFDAETEESRVEKIWPDIFARSRGLEAAFLQRRTGLKNVCPPAGDPKAGRAWPSDRCYTSDTEVLTGRGWVAWPDVLDSDTFATRAENGAVVYSGAVERVRVAYEGELVRFRSKLIDLAVTPNHNMLVARDCVGGDTGAGRGKYKEAFDLVSAETIETELYEHKTYAIRLPKTATWVDHDCLTCDIGGRSVQAHLWAELVGWVLTDGYIARPETRTHNVSVTQVDPVDRRRIGELFEACGARVYWAADRVGTCDPTIYRAFAAMGGRKHDGNRRVPRDLLESGPRALHALLEGAWGGDGWTTKTGTQRICVGVSRGLAGDLQEAALRLGGIASVTERIVKSGRTLYEVAIYGSKKHAAPRLTARNVDRVFYRGDVHCVRVPPFATLLVRQHGHAVWSGNTWEAATRAHASATVHHLSAVEREEFVAAFIGEATASEFFEFETQQDLADPALVLDGKEKFTHTGARLDRTAALLAGCTALVTPPKAAKRKERTIALWSLIGELVSNKMDMDVMVPTAAILVQHRLHTEQGASKVLATIQPLLKAADIRAGDL